MPDKSYVQEVVIKFVMLLNVFKLLKPFSKIFLGMLNIIYYNSIMPYRAVRLTDGKIPRPHCKIIHIINVICKYDM